MKKEDIDILVKSGVLRIKQPDMEKIKSLIKSAEINSRVALNFPLTEDSATLVFRELYESIRQLGEARWLILGYEPQKAHHEISLEILKDISIKEKIKFNYLDRFKKIRHDANYSGFRVSVSQAREIIDFWNKCGKEVMDILKKLLK